jgi:hypothetical protein
MNLQPSLKAIRRRALKTHLLDAATRRSAESLAKELFAVPSEPYSRPPANAQHLEASQQCPASSRAATKGRRYFLSGGFGESLAGAEAPELP